MAFTPVSGVSGDPGTGPSSPTNQGGQSPPSAPASPSTTTTPDNTLLADELAGQLAALGNTESFLGTPAPSVPVPGPPASNVGVYLLVLGMGVVLYFVLRKKGKE